jgi:uncharacterized protein YecE (DUF72 family)
LGIGIPDYGLKFSADSLAFFGLPHPTKMRCIGTAGWSVPADLKQEGTHLHRYSRVFSCVEINSSFYRSHRISTWAKWARETPAGFRFSIKAPKTITHEAKLRDTKSLLEDFLAQIEPLAEKKGPILFQLPPSLAFDPSLAEEFLITLRKLYQTEAALEPRHPSWFNTEANSLLQKYKIARVAADPPKGGDEASKPGGDADLAYYRLHGSPRIYYSNYDDEFLDVMAAELKSYKNAWVIFDNTALACAYTNALRLQAIVRARGRSTS